VRRGLGWSYVDIHNRDGTGRMVYTRLEARRRNDTLREQIEAIPMGELGWIKVGLLPFRVDWQSRLVWDS
jgi:hypothetical protein